MSWTNQELWKFLWQPQQWNQQISISLFANQALGTWNAFWCQLASANINCCCNMSHTRPKTHSCGYLQTICQEDVAWINGVRKAPHIPRYSCIGPQQSLQNCSLCSYLRFVFFLELHRFLLSCSIKFNGIGVLCCAEEFTMYKILVLREKKNLDIVPMQLLWFKNFKNPFWSLITTPRCHV